MLAGKKVQLYADNPNGEPYTKDVEVKKNGELKLIMQSGGGFVIKQENTLAK